MEIGAVLKGTYVIEVPGPPGLWVIVASLLNAHELCIDRGQNYSYLCVRFCVYWAMTH